MDPVAQAGCAVDSPIVALNLKGEKEDRRAGRRWRGEKTWLMRWVGRDSTQRSLGVVWWGYRSSEGPHITRGPCWLTVINDQKSGPSPTPLPSVDPNHPAVVWPFSYLLS
ncbi:hypothetical protein INR49_021718 [Caranx melampygus]|nr:hypothetical protein INR49_021718 [Caranx melampygus]